MTGRAPYLTSRLQGFGTTIFAEMSALAVRTGAINLGQGFPDTDGPTEVADAAVAAIRAGHNQYPPGPGIPELRAAIADHQHRFWGLDVDPETEVLVTAGATEAIAAALLALCEPGDEVLTFEPTYDSYGAAAAMAGAALRVVTLEPPDLRRRRRRAGPSRHAPDPPAAAQLAAQPHRQGVQPRGARRHRRAVRRARPHRGHRRGLRAPRLRRRARAALATLPGHGRAHAHHLVGGQDVLVHRLEDRLGVRAGRAGRGGAHGQAVPHLRQRRPVPARGGGRPRPARLVLRRSCATRWRPSATCCATASRRPASRCTGRQAPTSSPPTPAPSGSTTAPSSAACCPSAAGWWRCRAPPSTSDPERGRHLVRFAFCKRDEVLDEAVARLAKL